MTNHKLKNGKNIITDIWDLNELDTYMEKNMRSCKTDSGSNIFIDFNYFGMNTCFWRIREDHINFRSDETHYRDCKEINPFEDQKNKSKKDYEYDFSAVALIDNELVGLHMFQWINRSNTFWRYSSRFIDVRKDKRNKGIGTLLIKEIAVSDIIKNKILEFGNYSDDGKDYIEHVINREFDCKDYVIIPKGYLMNKTPERYGFFDRYGQKI